MLPEYGAIASLCFKCCMKMMTCIFTILSRLPFVCYSLCIVDSIDLRDFRLGLWSSRYIIFGS